MTISGAGAFTTQIEQTMSTGDARLFDNQPDSASGIAARVTSSCPSSAPIGWSDGSPQDQVTPDCILGDEETPSQFSISTKHAYTQPGHYKVQR